MTLCRQFGQRRWGIGSLVYLCRSRKVIIADDDGNDILVGCDGRPIISG